MKKNQLKQDLIDSVVQSTCNTGQILVGANLTLVQGKHWGMASTLTEANVHANFIEETGRLHELPIDVLLQKFLSNRVFESSLGMAALNSSIDFPKKHTIQDAYEEIERRSAGKNVAVVGHFPFVNKLRTISKNCWVFERKLQDGDLPVEKMPEYLPQANVLVLTAQVVANNCFQKIVDFAPQAFKIMLGPSTPLSPVLFDYGIDILGGVRITDPGLVYRYVSQGAHFKQLRGIEKITLSRNS